MTTTKHADPVRALVTLVEELCDSVDANAEGIGGGRAESTILREIGPLIKPAQEALRALPEPISSRELIKRCGGDPDAPFLPGPFPPEMREPSPLLPEPREFAPDKGLGKREDWAIDTHSTPSPILTYQSCSVIEGDQAHELLRLVEREIDARDSDPKAAPPAIVEKYAEPLKRLAKKIEAMPLDVLREHLREFYAEAMSVRAEKESAEAKIGRDFLDVIEACRPFYPWLSDWAPAEHYGELIGDLLDIAFPDSSTADEKREEAEVFVRNYLLERDEACGFLHPEDAADPEDERKESAREIVEHILSGEGGAGPVGEVSVELMQRIWANLFCDEGDAGFTFQGTLNDVVDWLAARGALPEPEAKGEAGAGPVGETYYDKGKDADHFERLNNKDFAWALTCAAQDLNDSAENVSEWMPVTAFLDGAAERIKALEAAPLSDIEGRHWREKVDALNAECETTLLRAETAEAALAETRERLEKAVAEEREACAHVATSFLVGDPANGVPLRSPMSHEIAERIRARAALSTQESSAALAGDGKEAGR